MRNMIIRKSDNMIVNSIDLDPGAQYEIDTVNFRLMPGDGPIGWILQGNTPVNPNPPLTLVEQEDALKDAAEVMILEDKALKGLSGVDFQLVNDVLALQGAQPMTQVEFDAYLRSKM